MMNKMTFEQYLYILTMVLSLDRKLHRRIITFDVASYSEKDCIPKKARNRLMIFIRPFFCIEFDYAREKITYVNIGLWDYLMPPKTFCTSVSWYLLDNFSASNVSIISHSWNSYKIFYNMPLLIPLISFLIK